MARIRGFEFPDELFYLVEQDIWARLEIDGLVTVGMTSLGCEISGEFVAFMPKPIGTEIERDRSLGALEMSKAIRSARAPVTGILIAVNEALAEKPALINDDSYGAGWLVRMRPTQWDQDMKMLVTGERLGAAVEAYIDIQLVEYRN